MISAADMGRHSSRATPSSRDAPYRQFRKATRRTIHLSGADRCSDQSGHLWDCRIAFVDRRAKAAHVAGALRRDHADLCQMPAQAVEQLDTRNNRDFGCMSMA